MSHPIQTVAAAIAEIAEAEIAAAGVPNSDTDGVSRIMADAETVIANQLAREGMDLTEAQDLAGRASMQTGRTSPASAALAADANRNRHATLAPVPQPATTNSASATDADGADMTESLIESAQPRVLGLATAPAAARPRPVSREPEPLGYDVVHKRVHEVFRGIGSGEPGFDFELPVVNWHAAHPKIPKLDPHYSFDLNHLMTVLYAITEGVSLNIVGPHGAGKTQLVHQIAARLNFPVTTLPMDGQLSRRELIGQEKLRATEFGNESYFAPGLLVRALAEPGFVLFDEVDRGVSDLQYACHSVYLQEGLTLLEDAGRIIPFHEHNRVFATANTKGRGSMDGMYQPPEEMSEATRDRWSLWLEVGYQEPDEDAQVVLTKTPGIRAAHADIIAKVAGDIRQSYLQGKLSQTCSMRQQLETARMAVFLCRRESEDERIEKCLRMAFDRVILGRASEADRGAIETQIEVRIPRAFQGDPLY